MLLEVLLLDEAARAAGAFEKDLVWRGLVGSLRWGRFVYHDLGWFSWRWLFWLLGMIGTFVDHQIVLALEDGTTVETFVHGEGRSRGSCVDDSSLGTFFRGSWVDESSLRTFFRGSCIDDSILRTLCRGRCVDDYILLKFCRREDLTSGFIQDVYRRCLFTRVNVYGRCLLRRHVVDRR